MTVTLNEPALHRLLDARDGPVGRDLQQRADGVVNRAQVRVAIIMARSPVRVENDVGLVIEENPLRAVIGIRETGSITRYLARKEQREGGAWLVPSLRESFSV